MINPDELKFGDKVTFENNKYIFIKFCFNYGGLPGRYHKHGMAVNLAGDKDRFCIDELTLGWGEE